MRLAATLMLVFGTMTFQGCAPMHVHRLGEQRYAPLPAGADVRLFLNDFDEEKHEAIAVIHSFSSKKDDVETRRRQLEDITKRARRVGAEAVVGVLPLTQNLKGIIPDETTPFPSPTQGKSTRYFFRGVAVRLIEVPAGESDDAEALLVEATTEEIEATERATPRAGDATSFTVRLNEVGPDRVAVIRQLSASTGLSLAEARALVEGAPTDLATDLSESEAEDLVRALEEAGADAEIK